MAEAALSRLVTLEVDPSSHRRTQDPSTPTSAQAAVVSGEFSNVTGGVKCSHEGRGQKQPPRVGRLVMKEG